MTDFGDKNEEISRLRTDGDILCYSNRDIVEVVLLVLLRNRRWFLEGDHPPECARIALLCHLSVDDTVADNDGLSPTH